MWSQGVWACGDWLVGNPSPCIHYQPISHPTTNPILPPAQRLEVGWALGWDLVSGGGYETRGESEELSGHWVCGIIITAPPSQSPIPPYPQLTIRPSHHRYETTHGSCAGGCC